MLKWSAPLAALTLAACGRPDVGACEIFIKDGLRSPSTYRLISMSERDEKTAKLPLEEGVDALQRLGWEADKSQHGVRSIIINYDAANAYGTSIRGQQMCTFSMLDGKLQGDAASFDAAAAHRRVQEAIDAAARSGALPNVNPADLPPAKPRSCC